MTFENPGAAPEHITARQLGSIIDGTNLTTPAGQALDQAFNRAGIDFTTQVVGNLEAWVGDASPEDLSTLFELYETLIKRTISEPSDLKAAAKAFVDKLESL